MFHFAHQPSEGATGEGTGTGEGSGEESETGKRQESQKNTFIIAGSVAGGILLIALILLILWRCNSPKYVLLQFSKLIRRSVFLSSQLAAISICFGWLLVGTY